MLYLLLAASCGRPNAEGPQEISGGGNMPRASAPGADEKDATRAPANIPTHTEMRNVDLRIMEGATLHVRRLSGDAISAKPGQPVGLDDKTSYEIRVQNAEITVDYADLARVMNDYTLAFEGAPLSDLEMSREEDRGEEDQIELRGHLSNALGLPFEIEGRPELTPDGKIRIRTTAIQALEISVGGLMDALGLEPKDLIGNLEDRGLGVDGDDLILDASRAMPPPRMAGRVRAVKVGAAGLALSLGSATSRQRAAPGRSNYLWFREGTIRIGKMTQRDADLRIVDQDPRDPFDFYPDRMSEQLAAGYAKLAVNGGLTMFVPDYGDMH